VIDFSSGRAVRAWHGTDSPHQEATMTNLERIRKSLSPARRRRIASRAAALMADEQALQQLRRAQGMTQVAMAEALGIGQDGVSRLEQRSDMRLSTLRGYVEALGGKLSIVATFPGQEPVVLSAGAEASPVGAAPSTHHGTRRRRTP